MGKVYPFLANEWITTYAEIRNWRDKNMVEASFSHESLNQFHDEVIKKVVSLSTKKIESEWGTPPTHFAFFMMGSAARFEQSVWSDQDHGIVFQENENSNAQEYFLKLGKEISKGLDIAGYEFCDGQVMASNPRWCKSLSDWKSQLNHWLEEESFETNRYLLTFFDSRVFYGNDQFLLELKELIFTHVRGNPLLLKRFFDNVSHMRKVVGIFGQLLVETTGVHTGCIHFKELVLFPYVNVLRILAIKENIVHPSTIIRFQELPAAYPFVKKYENSFVRLLDLRLKHQREEKSYDSVHYLNVNRLSAKEKAELKNLIISGRQLFQQTKKEMEKGCKKSWL